MKTIDVLLQGEAIADIEVVTVGQGATARDILNEAARLRRQPLVGQFLVFIEGEVVPLDLECPLPEANVGQPLRAHVHRCRSVAVDITFNGVTKEHHFGPGITVEAVKKWAAIAAFHMTPADAAEHVLQLSGTTTRPDPDTHIGALVSGTECRIRFDLVPLKRVEG